MGWSNLMWPLFANKAMLICLATTYLFLYLTASTSSTRPSFRRDLLTNNDKLFNTIQFGFRARKSTAQALYISRILQEFAEQTGTRPLYFRRLGNAFDKVDQRRMFEALTRFSIHDTMANHIAALYRNPTFKVEKGDDKSSWRKQHSGIRQGCPLSPYLFILLMTVLFHDIRDSLGDQIQERAIEGFDEREILYADDTLLVLPNEEAMTKLLNAIVVESSYYGLKLNRDKFMAINMNSYHNVTFLNGQPMQHVDNATHLCGILTHYIDHNVETNARIASCIHVMTSLDIFCLENRRAAEMEARCLQLCCCL